MNEPKKTRGWIDGEHAIIYQRCEQCGHSWYFWRSFCPGCGVSEPECLEASGRGQVYAASMVHRAPSQELRTHVPYLIVIIDADEGFRLMAHGESTLTIGDRVQARFVEFGSRLIPYFEKTDEPG
ncbi:MAG: OB-fold domain-containing protein [Betaproteobacteria bacterium]|nr:MAG: OB-fold domain-containing protein [Betaproteobacteria bacterium]